MAVFATGAIENRGRDIKSLAVHAANVGAQPANVLLEVFHTRNAEDGPSAQEMYVQRLVSIAPDQLQTFDNIFADLDAVTVRVTTSGPGQDAVAVTVAARDAQRRRIPGIASEAAPRVFVPPADQTGFSSNRPIVFA